MKAPSPTEAHGQLWAVDRHSLIRRPDAENRPNQSPSLFGACWLLGQTKKRVRVVSVPGPTVVITLRNHAGYLDEALDGVPLRRVLVQPEDEGRPPGHASSPEEHPLAI
jgi:hypothetical protein